MLSLRQTTAHRLGDGGKVLTLGLWEPHRACQRRVVAEQGSRLLGAYPPYEVELGVMPVYILQRHLRFADAAHAVQGGERCCALGQSPVQRVEQVVAPGQVRVAQVGDVPDRRQDAGKASGTSPWRLYPRQRGRLPGKGQGRRV